MSQNMVLLDRVELNTTTASVTFSNIPQTGYTDLKIVISGRSNRTNSDPGSDLGIVFNGSSSGYSFKSLNGDGSSAGSGGNTSGSTIGGTLIDSSYATANTFGSTEVYIPNYTSSTAKSASIETVTETNATTAFMRLIAALWSGTAAISSITFTETNGFSFVAGSTFSLYGVAAYGTTPAIAPKADGGNIIATDGTYWYHAFLSSGTFTPQTNLTADVLVIAGGGSGGGGSGGAGGGGAGGYRTGSLSLSTTGYTCTIGAGGAAVGQNVNGNYGSDSTFSSITSTGGGRGALESNAGGNGGSGGGSSYTGTGAGSGNTPSTSPSQGNNGGNAATGASSYPGSGGGGAGGVGGNGSGSTGGAGGAGSNSVSSWATATNTGVSGYYAGGGGGGTRANGSGGAGGSGGGGLGSGGSTAAGAGVINTGGGGGGGVDTPQNSGAGGSGIIIIRYPVAS